MVPAAFVALDRIPLTTGGKVDRAALPAPAPPDPAGPRAAPREGAEAVLAGVWADVLGVAEVGLDDNFFELGGDSILSIQVVSRARAAGLALAARDVFVYQTIAELSAAGRLEPARADAPAAARTDPGGPAPLGPIQRWFTQEWPGDRDRFTMSMAVDADPRVTPAVLRPALAAVIARHEALRMRFTCRDDGQWAQEPAPAQTADVLTARDLSAVPAGRRAAAMHEAAVSAQASLDITSGPLLRAVLFGFGGEDEAGEKARPATPACRSCSWPCTTWSPTASRGASCSLT